MAEKIKSYSAGILAVVFIGSLFWFGVSLAGSATYEVKPEISVPEYKSDTRRAIEANERLMDRYIDMTDRGMSRLADDNRQIMAKLDEIAADVEKINGRLSRIEKALGIETPADPDTAAAASETYDVSPTKDN